MNSLRAFIPRPIKHFVKYVYLGAIDITDFSARRKDMIPPRRHQFVGHGDYKAAGLEFRDLFIRAGLKPKHRVMDVGCGQGRMAVPLTGFLTGQYDGFDIVKSGIEWCQKNISSRYPNFHFNHADIRNNGYNPNGQFEAATYQFPYEDGSFDFVFLTSVFTHMFPRDLENYLSEIHRCLKPEGICFITFFILNEESKQLIKEKLSHRNFIYQLDGCMTTNPEIPEDALAFEESYIRDVFSGFVLDPVQYGSWCGRKNFLSYQDIVRAQKL